MSRGIDDGVGDEIAAGRVMALEEALSKLSCAMGMAYADEAGGAAALVREAANWIAERSVAMDAFADVGAFHAKMGLPVAGKVRLGLMSHADFRYRVSFLFEEMRELIEAQSEGSIADAADALADLVWVACGTAHYMGVPLDRVWAEVRRANMEKRPWREGDPVKPRNMVNTSGEVVKPDGWRGPDVHGVITDFAAAMRRGTRI